MIIVVDARAPGSGAPTGPVNGQRPSLFNPQEGWRGESILGDNRKFAQALSKAPGRAA